MDLSSIQPPKRKKRKRPASKPQGASQIASHEKGHATHEEPDTVRIIHKDNDLLVVYKPRYMACHPSPGHELENSLVHHVQELLRQEDGDSAAELSNVDCTEDIFRPGIVHRIDMGTSGLLLMARNNEAHLHLKDQFKTHRIERTYYCLTHNHFRDTKDTINVPIGRHPSIPTKRVPRSQSTTKKKNTFKDACTHYKVLRSYTDKSRNKYSLVKCNLETGRTHQIRVHLSMLGRALVGDKLYGSKKQPFKQDTQVLHAKSLGFVHPTTKEHMSFNSPLPQYFQDVLSQLKKVE